MNRGSQWCVFNPHNPPMALVSPNVLMQTNPMSLYTQWYRYKPLYKPIKCWISLWNRLKSILGLRRNSLASPGFCPFQSDPWPQTNEWDVFVRGCNNNTTGIRVCLIAIWNESPLSNSQKRSIETCKGSVDGKKGSLKIAENSWKIAEK